MWKAWRKVNFLFLTLLGNSLLSGKTIHSFIKGKIKETTFSRVENISSPCKLLLPQKNYKGLRALFKIQKILNLCPIFSPFFSGDNMALLRSSHVSVSWRPIIVHKELAWLSSSMHETGIAHEKKWKIFSFKKLNLGYL